MVWKRGLADGPANEDSFRKTEPSEGGLAARASTAPLSRENSHPRGATETTGPYSRRPWKEVDHLEDRLISNPLLGRGAASNPANRFERLDYTPDPEEEPARVPTQLYKDNSKTVLNDNGSPDIEIKRGLNVYRGCSQGWPC